MSAPDPHTPSLLRRKGCWLIFLTGIPLLIGLAWVVEDQAGQRFLAKTKARLAAEGRVLDPEKILPARPPDAENFCAVPLLLEIGKGHPTSPEFEAVRQIAEWESFLRYKAGKKFTSQENPAPTDWSEVWRLIEKYDPKAGLPPKPADAARELSVIIEAKAGKAFSELEAALDRPVAMMLPPARDEPANRKPREGLAWFNELRGCSVSLELRGRMALADDDPVRAAATVRVMLRLADGAEAHGTLIASLVGISIRSRTLPMVWTGLRDKAFGRDDVLALQNALASYDGQVSMVFTYEREAAYSARAWERIRADPYSILEAGGFRPNEWGRLALELIPRGWFDFNEGATLAMQADWLKFIANEQNPHRFARDSWPGLKRLKRGFPYHDFIARSVAPLYSSIPLQFATNLTVTHLAEVACALEAHFIAHQRYPASLDALVPEFLSAVPMDLDLKPIRYAQASANGRYKLWSVGVNGTDEGGVEKAERSGSTPRPWREPVGDWVWRYP